jgi:hypothetical protein
MGPLLAFHRHFLAADAVKLSRTLPHAKLAILPGGHGDYIGEITAPDKDSKLPALVVAIIEEFLKGETR